MFAVASPAAAVMRSGTVDRYMGGNIVLAGDRARSIAGGIGSLCLALPALPSTDEVLRCADIVGGSSGCGRMEVVVLVTVTFLNEGLSFSGDSSNPRSDFSAHLRNLSARLSVNVRKRESP